MYSVSVVLDRATVACARLGQEIGAPAHIKIWQTRINITCKISIGKFRQIGFKGATCFLKKSIRGLIMIKEHRRAKNQSEAAMTPSK